MRFRPMQLRRAQQLIASIMDDPDEYPSHFSMYACSFGFVSSCLNVSDPCRFSAAVALSAVYDYEPTTREDRMVSIVDSFLRVAVPGLSPGKVFLMMAFPFRMCVCLIHENDFADVICKVLHTPDWFFGSWIKREVNEAYALRNELVETPYRYVQERMVSIECAGQ